MTSTDKQSDTEIQATGEPLIVNSLELECDPMFGEGMGVTLRNGHFGNKFGAP